MKTTIGRIPVSSRVYEFPRTCEAFDVFRRLSNAYGESSVFLLDSITDFQKRNCNSLIGFRPVLTVRLKGRSVKLEGMQAVVSPILQAFNEAGVDPASFRCKVTEVLRLIARQFHQTASMPLPPYSFGFLGYFGYDSVRYIERLPELTEDDRGLDDIRLQIHQVMLQFDQSAIRVIITEIPGIDTPDITDFQALLQPLWEYRFAGFDRNSLDVADDVTFDTFVERVRKAKEYIAAGDIFQVVLSKRLRVIGEIDSQQVYFRLKQMNPSPYMFFVNYGDYQVLGASPEVQVRMENGRVLMKPIAGTSKGKGRTSEDNVRLRYFMQMDEKERAEHVMLVDLCRNDLGRVCKTGTIHVEKFLDIEEYSHVFHMVSTVTGEVAPEYDVFDVFFATFPNGTLSGAPKIRAMEIIEELETYRRGPYGGAIGCMDFQGNLNTAIVIRTVIHQNGVSYLQAGAGIVMDSDPIQEWNECNHKLAALRSTIFT
jgi:anthranilate synthase component I